VELFFLSLTSDIYAEDSDLDAKNNLVVYFILGTFEIEQRSFNNLFNKLDQSLYYMIQGYSCSSDRGSKKDLLLKAEKRAEIVKERLIRKGFPANKLNIIAYDKSSKCKVTLINLE
jgi:outer membrane protein OmpA-like peptidoglycan-associated protein